MKTEQSEHVRDNGALNAARWQARKPKSEQLPLFEQQQELTPAPPRQPRRRLAKRKETR